MPPPIIWVYRVGRMSLERDHQRSFWGETWISFTPPPADATLALFLNQISFLYVQPFGGALDRPLYNTRGFSSEIYPRTFPLTKPVSFVFGPAAPLNKGAPEAAFRLQRVGAGRVIGRYCPPVPDDTWFTDLPRRRRVDLSRLAPWLAFENTQPGRFAQVWGGRTYQNAVWHRKTKTFTLVTSHNIHPNPVRLWQRYKNYVPGQHLFNDEDWTPPQRELFGT